MTVRSFPQKSDPVVGPAHAGAGLGCFLFAGCAFQTRPAVLWPRRL